MALSVVLTMKSATLSYAAYKNILSVYILLGLTKLEVQDWWHGQNLCDH